MDKQYTQAGTATITAGGTAQAVSLGWQPTYVRCFSVNNLTTYEWFYGMDDDTSLNVANHDTTQVSVNAAGGITVSESGFTMGTDIADTTADVVRWFASR